MINIFDFEEKIKSLSNDEILYKLYEVYSEKNISSKDKKLSLVKKNILEKEIIERMN
jgi:hypothetical protein